MAAAVMRAMTFGASSSSSSLANSTSSPASSRGRDGSASRSRSRSSSKQRPGGKGAHNDGEDEGRAALSRTSSVLLSSAPEVQPQSILLNPSTTRSPPLSPAQAPVSSSLTGRVDDDLDLDDLQSPTPRPGYARSTSTSSVASHNGVPVAPLSAGFPTEAAFLAARNAAPSAPTSPSRPPNTQRASKIRFAPLPEIRPRAYSTGRNVWVVEEDDPTATGGRRQRLVRVNGEYDDDDEDFGDSDFARFDDDSALGTSPSNSLMKWGSWTEALGLSPSTSRRSADEDALSLTSSVSPSSESGLSAAFGSPGSGGSSKKILKALGLGGKTGKTKRTGKENDDHLTRTSSAESHSSHGRRASMSEGTAPPRAQGSTGIPMQRSSTWEVGDVPESKGPEIAGERGAGPVYYASPARTSRRRAQYPPVAQGRNRRKVRGNVAVEEPAFEEWGAVGVGSNAKKRSVVGSAPSDNGFDDDDDGTGMAWLRRRRLQREQEERERALQEVALAEAAEQHGSAPLESQPPSVDAVSSSANEFPAGEENQDTLTRDPTQRGPTDEDRRMPLPFLIRTPPSRSGTVDSTVSTASTVRPSSPATSTKPSGLSATRPVLAVDTHVETAAEADQQADDDALLSPGEIGEDDDEAAIESESESSEAESEDDDLDEEELAREEALAEEARRMAKSMGAERYHSARHENQLKVVDA